MGANGVGFTYIGLLQNILNKRKVFGSFNNFVFIKFCFLQLCFSDFNKQCVVKVFQQKEKVFLSKLNLIYFRCSSRQ